MYADYYLRGLHASLTKISQPLKITLREVLGASAAEISKLVSKLPKSPPTRAPGAKGVASTVAPRLKEHIPSLEEFIHIMRSRVGNRVSRKSIEHAYKNFVRDELPYRQMAVDLLYNVKGFPAQELAEGKQALVESMIARAKALHKRRYKLTDADVADIATSSAAKATPRASAKATPRASAKATPRASAKATRAAQQEILQSQKIPRWVWPVVGIPTAVNVGLPLYAHLHDK